MKRSKWRAISLCVLATTAFMAFAANAQATTNWLPEWLINGATPTFPTLIDGLRSPGPSFEILGLTISCAHEHFHGNLTAKSTVVATFAALGCAVTEGEESCALAEEEIVGVKRGLTVSGPASKGPHYIRWTPQTGSAFTTIILEDGVEECILIEPGAGSEELEVTGNLCGEIAEGSIDMNSAIQSTCLAKGITTGLFIGANEATFNAGKSSFLRSSDNAPVSWHLLLLN